MHKSVETIRSKQIYDARIPAHMRKSKQEAQAPTTKPNSYMSFASRIAKGRDAADTLTTLLEGTTMIEGVDKSQVIVWLQKAQDVVSTRADQIDVIEEKKKFQDLAGILKEAIPGESLNEEDIDRTLALLKQRIVVESDDSDHLKSLKNHLLNQIQLML